MMEGARLETRYVPVTEHGERWTGRTKEEADRAMYEYPVGGEFSDGFPWDGITHIEREERWVTEWTVAE